jgi:hypothetical protein
MDPILDAARDALLQLQRNIAGHVVMALVFGAITFTLAFTVILPVSFSPVIAMALDPDHPGPVFAIVGGLAAAGVLLFAVPYAILHGAYLGATAREAAGGPPVSFGEVWALAKANAGRLLVTDLLIGCMTVVAIAMCYFPVFLVGICTWHASMLVTAAGLSPTEALGECWRAARQNPGRQLVLFAGYFGLALIGGMIPMIGAFVTIPVTAAYSARTLKLVFPEIPVDRTALV